MPLQHSDRGYSSTRSLDKAKVLLRVALLDITLDDTVHDQVRVNIHHLLDLVRVHNPLALNQNRARGRLAVDAGGDAVGLVEEGEFESGGADGALVCDLVWYELMSAVVKHEKKKKKNQRENMD